MTDEVLNPAFGPMLDCTTLEGAADWLLANPQVLLDNIGSPEMPDFAILSVRFLDILRDPANDSFVGEIEIEFTGRILRPYRLLVGSGLEAGFLKGFSSSIIVGNAGTATIYRARYSVTLRSSVWQKMAVFHRLANAEQYAD